MFNYNNKQNNYLISDNLRKYYKNAKEDLKRAKILFPSMKDKKDQLEDEIEEFERLESSVPKINKENKKEETEEEHNIRLANALYPNMKDKKETDKSPTANKKYNGIGLENSELYALLETKENKEKPLNTLDKNDNNKTKGTTTGGAAPFKTQEYKIKNLDDKQTEKEVLKDITTPTIRRVRDNSLNNVIDSLNKEEEKIDNTVFSDNAWKMTRDLIQKEENFEPKAYKPTNKDVWTIGYGHTQGVKEGDTITEAEAHELYKKDFEEHSRPLKYVKVPLNDNQKAALTSLIFNIGPTAFKNSTLLKKLNQGDIQGAADEFDVWIYDNGEISQGLIKRRAKEKEKFLHSDK